ncbi:MAG TPA: galactokinase [Candidatus Fimenecus stercoravium]|nr:galactokinase [Candidatus Fimenecus stercoravium]
MPNVQELKAQLMSGAYDDRLRRVYVTDDAVQEQRARYAALAETFASLYNADRDVRLFSAPGRTEVGGNHTDHNHGRVLAAGINLDAAAAAAKNDENIVRVKSAGYDMDVVDLADLSVHEDERGHSPALVRGMCQGFLNHGYKIGGFDAATVSQVLSGSGLSSSAAYEVLVGVMLNALYNDGAADAVTIAKIAQYAENEYFGKPCGLMDQTACAVGSFVTIDFADPKNPAIEEVKFDFAACSHALCIVDTKGSHSDLTDEYAYIREEMESVAQCFGKTVLREVPEADFYAALPSLRKKVGDRAILRAMHFYADNARVLKEVAALRAGDFESFKQYIRESGFSSFMYNQNVFSVKKPQEQPVALALAVSQQVLEGRGAWRVHGGGFAGTIQAFVPLDLLDAYKSAMESVFGAGTCYVLSIRPVGGVEI